MSYRTYLLQQLASLLALLALGATIPLADALADELAGLREAGAAAAHAGHTAPAQP